LLAPIFVAAAIVFVASSVIHMFTPFHKGDLKRVPNEGGVMSALRNFNLAPGADYLKVTGGRRSGGWPMASFTAC
jgi:hypothetical protein